MTPLRPMDAAWLHMDRPDNPLVINAVLLLEAGVDIEAVISRFLDVVVYPYPRFQQVIAESPVGVGPPMWVPAGLTLADHIHRVRLPEPGTLGDLCSFIGTRMSEPLPRGRPLWSLTVISGRATGQVGLLFRAHHVIGDGMALGKLLMSVCDEEDVGLPRPSGRSQSEQRSVIQKVAHGLEAGLDVARAAEELLGMPRDPDSILTGPLSGRKLVAWSEPVSLADVRAIREAFGGTVNDVFVAALSGALRRVLEVHDHLPDIHALVPVYLRPLDAPVPEELGNHFAPVIIRLPTSSPDPVVRLRHVRTRIDALKDGQMLLVAAAAVNAMGMVPRPVEHLIVDFFAERASLILTNVPGPREVVHVCGARVDDIVFFVPQPADIGLGLSLFSYRGHVRLGVAADALRLTEPDRVAQAFVDELAVLVEEARHALK